MPDAELPYDNNPSLALGRALPPRVRCRQRLRDGCRLLWFDTRMLFHRTPREFERFSRELKSPLPENEIFKAEIKTPKWLRRFKGRRCRDKPYPSNPANSGINHRELVDLMLPAAEKIVLVLEAIGDDTFRVNSSSLDHPL